MLGNLGQGASRAGVPPLGARQLHAGPGIRLPARVPMGFPHGHKVQVGTWMASMGIQITQPLLTSLCPLYFGRPDV